MNRSDVKQYQLFQLQLLKRFIEISNEIGICYYAVAGTLLGAVREKGFIDWDPDIDIALFREDYEKLRLYFRSHPDNIIIYDHYETNKIHISPHAILRIRGTHVIYKKTTIHKYNNAEDGVYIDIFPIDKIPTSKTLRNIHLRTIMFLRRIISLKDAPIYIGHTSRTIRVIKNIISLLLSPFSLYRMNYYIDRVMQAFNTSTSVYYTIAVDKPGYLAYFRKEEYVEPKVLPFEDIQISVPNQFHEYLRRRYGNYMYPPDDSVRWNYIDNSLDRIEYGEVKISTLRP